jgi:hypothetical protein
MNCVSPVVKVEGPRGVAIVAVRAADGGVAAGTTTAATAAAVALPSSASRVS